MHPPEEARANKTEVKVRVERSRGVCVSCGATGHVIAAYDPRVYKGRACPACVLSGKLSEYPSDSAIMRPMVWVARGLLGEQPFARLLREVDTQKKRSRRERRELQALARRAKKRRKKR